MWNFGDDIIQGMPRGIKCRQAKAAIRQLIGNDPFTSSFSKDEVIDHAKDCGKCKRDIERSIGEGSTSYWNDFESTLEAAREAIVKFPSDTEIHGTPWSSRR